MEWRGGNHIVPVDFRDDHLPEAPVKTVYARYVMEGTTDQPEGVTATIENLRAALTKAVETFEDMRTVCTLLSRPVLAESCRLARDGCKDALDAAQCDAIARTSEAEPIRGLGAVGGDHTP